MSTLLYNGNGAGKMGVSHLHDALLRLNLDVKLIDHRFFQQERWQGGVELLVIPGGRDIPYHKKFMGKINREIKKFVEDGGAYLGICAGGYYGAASIEFDQGGPLEVIGERELGFFPGVAIGPAYTDKRYVYASEEGARIAKLSYKGRSVDNYFNGGCYFHNADQYEGVEVVARYAELPRSPAAIVKCPLGNGMALLCGTHPEHPIDPDDEERFKFFGELLNNLLRKVGSH